MIWEENSIKSEIIKTFLENLNTITNSLHKSSDKNIDESYECRHSCRHKIKIPKNTVTIDSHYRDKFVEKEIPAIWLLNVDQDVVITNEVNNNGLSSNKKPDQVLRYHQKLLSKRPRVVVNNYSEN